MAEGRLRNGNFEAGDVAPDFTLSSVDGKPVSLGSELSGGRSVLLVFLRHLG